MCDTAAMVYLPLLEETGTVPSMKYVLAPEIHAHAERMAQRWDLHRRCLLSTQVSHLEWVEEAAAGGSRPIVATRSWPGT